MLDDFQRILQSALLVVALAGCSVGDDARPLQPNRFSKGATEADTIQFFTDRQTGGAQP